MSLDPFAPPAEGKQAPLDVPLDQARQNDPELVVGDLLRAQQDGPLTAEFIRRVLKWRGINKWLRNRRIFIALKDKWKQRIQAIDVECHALGQRAAECRRYAEELEQGGGPEGARAYRREAVAKERRLQHLRGYREALIDCRQQLRAICHSSRDIDWPDEPDWSGPWAFLPHDFPICPHKLWLLRWDRRNRREVEWLRSVPAAEEAEGE